MFSWGGEGGNKELPQKWIAEMVLGFGSQKIQGYENRHKEAM
jgi:hypothetical protein